MYRYLICKSTMSGGIIIISHCRMKQYNIWLRLVDRKLHHFKWIYKYITIVSVLEFILEHILHISTQKLWLNFGCPDPRLNAIIPDSVLFIGSYFCWTKLSVSVPQSATLPEKTSFTRFTVVLGSYFPQTTRLKIYICSRTILPTDNALQDLHLF